MAGGTGTSSRGRGGKFKKYTRGGGKHFSRDLRPRDADGNEISMWSEDAQRKDDEDDEDEDDDTEEESEDSEESEEGDSDDEGPSQAVAQANSREDRKAQKKARKEAAIAKQKGKTIEVGDLPSSDEDSDEDDDDMPANPNHSKAARNQTKASGVDEITEGVAEMAAPSRREREAIEAAAAKEKYLRLQAQGKTDEAKADLARLRLIREQRELEAARRQAEREEKEEIEKQKKAEFEAKLARKKDVKKGKKK